MSEGSKSKTTRKTSKKEDEQLVLMAEEAIEVETKKATAKKKSSSASEKKSRPKKKSPDLPAEEVNETENSAAKTQGFEIKISHSLQRKLKQQAEEEGISLEEFISELLSESVVLRAWEIVERKNAMRGSMPSSSNQRNNAGGNSANSGGYSNNNHRGGSQRRNHRGGMSHGRYQNIMDDKASFLEYVRNQERSRR